MNNALTIFENAISEARRTREAASARARFAEAAIEAAKQAPNSTGRAATVLVARCERDHFSRIVAACDETIAGLQERRELIAAVEA